MASVYDNDTGSTGGVKKFNPTPSNMPEMNDPWAHSPAKNGAGGSGYSGGGSGGSGGTSSAAYDPAASYAGYMNLQNQLYADREKRYRDAYSAQVAGRQALMDQGAADANSQAEDAMQQLYISRMMGERNLGQQMNALGRSGGAAESTLLGLANTYGTQRGEAQRSLEDQLAQLRLQYNQGVANDNVALQNALAENDIMKLQSLSEIEMEIAQAQQQAASRQAASLAGSVYGTASSGGTAAGSSPVYRNHLQWMYDNGNMNEDQLAAALQGMTVQQYLNR